MMLVARAIERIGDNAVDIGEQVAFVVTGEFREFSDASRVSTSVFGKSGFLIVNLSLPEGLAARSQPSRRLVSGSR